MAVGVSPGSIAFSSRSSIGSIPQAMYWAPRMCHALYGHRSIYRLTHGSVSGTREGSTRIELPDGFQPEGIESRGRWLFTGSLVDGAIAPWGKGDQPDFTNGVVELQTRLADRLQAARLLQLGHEVIAAE